MTLEEESRLSYYHEIATLNEAHGVMLVQHTETGRVFVKKVLHVFHADVYRYLQKNPVPHTPYIYDVIEEQDNLIVIEEYVSGRSLKEILDNEHTLSEEKAVKYTMGICDVLQGLHTVTPPIVHRDIKPSNIIITPAEEVVLLDMNAAKIVHDCKTEDTQLIGTHGYAAPEQYGFGASDVQADIYATGVLLNEMLTGKKPAATLATGRYGDIVTRCTMMEAKARYASARELSAALKGETEKADSDAHGYRRFLPPGFRSDDLFFKLLAIAGYVLLIAMALSMKLEDAPVLRQWTNRISFFIPAIAVVLFTGNYLNVWDFTHVNMIRNKWLKAIVIAAVDVVIFVILLAIIAGMENALFGRL